MTRNELCGLGSEPLGLIYRDESYRDDLTPTVSSFSNAVGNRTDLTVEKPKERRKNIIKARVARTMTYFRGRPESGQKVRWVDPRNR